MNYFAKMWGSGVIKSLWSGKWHAKNHILGALLRYQEYLVKNVLERRQKMGPLTVIWARGRRKGKEFFLIFPESLSSCTISSDSRCHHLCLLYLPCTPDLICCHILLNGRNLKVSLIQSSIHVWISPITSSILYLNISFVRELITLREPFCYW